MARSKPFSGKQKKDQLKEKKERKRIENAILENNLDISIQEKRKMAKELIKSNSNKSINNNQHVLSSKLIFPNNSNNNNNNISDEINSSDEENQENSDTDGDVEKSISHIKEINKQMEKFDKNNGNIGSNIGGGRRMNKLVTIFEKESRDEIELRKQNSKKPLDKTLREKPWLIMNEYTKENQISNNSNFIDIPKRPKWSYSMAADKLKQEERLMFSNWLSDIVKNYEKKRLNYFEHNLEVWRQLWRVSERSDVILLITDARYPLFHFPPSLYNYIHVDLKKPMILVLNKTDLVNKKIVDSWVDYFTKNYPSLKVICFSSFASFDSDFEDVTKKRKMKKGRKRYDLSKGKQNLIEAIKSLSALGSKSNLITNEDLNQESENQESEDNFSDNEDGTDSDISDNDQDDDDEEEDYFKNYYNDQCNQDFITIGMVGHPNVGKSSLINGLMGKKVVSTSRTPGHTKHFQTIVFSKNIQLLDCPGLVFPALDRPKQLQILCGLFPIAQVREPFSAIQYLAERVPVEQIYRLKNPHEEDREEWSAYSICEAFALKRGYLIAKSGRPDPHRAGLELLKDCVDGNIIISWPPPGISKEEYINLMSSDNNDNDGNNSQINNKDKSNLQQPVSKSTSKYKKKLKKKNLLNRIAYSDEDEDDEIDKQAQIDQNKFTISPKPTAFMALNSISSSDNDDSNDLDESDSYSEKENQEKQKDQQEKEKEKDQEKDNVKEEIEKEKDQEQEKGDVKEEKKEVKDDVKEESDSYIAKENQEQKDKQEKEKEKDQKEEKDDVKEEIEKEQENEQEEKSNNNPLSDHSKKGDYQSNIINIDSIINGTDTRNSIIFKNLPNRFSQSNLVKSINQRFPNSFDYIYIPMDKRTGSSYGYAFISFKDYKTIIRFYKCFEDCTWPGVSKKKCQIRYSNFQTREELIKMLKRNIKNIKKSKIVIYIDDGINKGEVLLSELD